MEEVYIFFMEKECCGCYFYLWVCLRILVFFEILFVVDKICWYVFWELFGWWFKDDLMMFLFLGDVLIYLINFFELGDCKVKDFVND